jgi:hypothetical protein
VTLEVAAALLAEHTFAHFSTKMLRQATERPVTSKRRLKRKKYGSRTIRVSVGELLDWKKRCED